MADQYDVFLSHSSADGPAVAAIATRLRDEAGLRPFLDAWHLVPGEPWMPAIERAIERSTTVAVFFGPRGRGAWHDQESQLALVLAADEHSKRVPPGLAAGGTLPEVKLHQLWGAAGAERLVDAVPRRLEADRGYPRSRESQPRPAALQSHTISARDHRWQE